MMLITEDERSLFPIKTANQFLEVVDLHIVNHEDSQPNLAYLSILFGYLEHELTINRIAASSSVEDDDDDTLGMANSDSPASMEFPILHLQIVEGLLKHFELTLKAQVDRSLPDFTTRSGHATKHLCKLVSDILWNGLQRSYHKDKAHIQSLFSFLTGKQLDCFGLAFTVVAACQILNYKDVHLVLSGDHAWVAHGENSKDMVEVTWHGKGTEDRRGFVINNSVMEKSWIYYGGQPVKCDRWMEFASLVVALNPSIDSHLDSIELKVIQFKILDILYSRGDLDRYPMGLGLYCELSEIMHSNVDTIQQIEGIHNKALLAVQTIYNNFHILPYCGKGHYCLRQGKCKEAIKCYSQAAQALAKYNYVKEDEEIYKEMVEIANEHIPQALKDDPALCEDPHCYFDVVQFYDGICLWEEESPTPVLHSWWVRYIIGALARFTSNVRLTFKDEDSIADSIHTNEARKRRFSTENQSPKTASSERSPEKRLKPVSKLRLRSEKMADLKDVLTSDKKPNVHAVSLLLTAQSQVHFVKRRSNVSDYSLEYNPYKRVRRSKDASF